MCALLSPPPTTKTFFPGVLLGRKFTENLNEGSLDNSYLYTVVLSFECLNHPCEQNSVTPSLKILQRILAHFFAEIQQPPKQHWLLKFALIQCRLQKKKVRPTIGGDYTEINLLTVVHFLSNLSWGISSATESVGNTGTIEFTFPFMTLSWRL